jgi:DNA-binding NtrC family response regulator
MAKPGVLIAVSDEGLFRLLRRSLVECGYEVIESPDRTSILRLIQIRKPDLIILGSCQDQALDGFELTHQIRKLDRRLPVIMITHTDELILAAFRAGVNDCLKRAFSVGELHASVQRCLIDQLTRKLPKSDLTASAARTGNWMIGARANIGEVRAFVEEFASTNSDILVTGETGTGKELLAEFIHLSSPRWQKPMVRINCAGISDKVLERELFGYERRTFTEAYSSNEGKLKLAEGGTVFFDEICEMSPYAQATILRATENRNVHESGRRRIISLDIRIIASTRQDVEASVKGGKIREDLYCRLSDARIHLPPLKEREDIPALLEYYLGTFNQVFGRQVEGFTDDVLENLLRYDWPGNVQELRNLMEAIFIGLRSNIISASDLPMQYRNKFKDRKGKRGSALRLVL